MSHAAISIGGTGKVYDISIFMLVQTAFTEMEHNTYKCEWLVTDGIILFPVLNKYSGICEIPLYLL